MTPSLSSLIGRVRELRLGTLRNCGEHTLGPHKFGVFGPVIGDADKNFIAIVVDEAKRNAIVEQVNICNELADAAERMQVAAGRAHEAVCLPGHSSPCCKCNQEVQQILGEALGREFLTVEEWEEADKEHWEMLSARVAELEGQIAQMTKWIRSSLYEQMHSHHTEAEVEAAIQDALELCGAAPSRPDMEK